MTNITIPLTEQEAWLLQVLRSRFEIEERKKQTLEGQVAIALLNKILKAVEQTKTPPAP